VVNNVGTSHMGKVQQMSVMKQRLIEHISMVTGRHNDRDTVTRGILSPVCMGGYDWSDLFEK
jgi:hypothetical protein